MNSYHLKVEDSLDKAIDALTHIVKIEINEFNNEKYITKCNECLYELIKMRIKLR